MADKDKQPKQADFDKAWENMKKGKGRLPYEDDMAPLPSKEEAAAERAKMQEALLKGATEGMGGKALGMKKGGKVKAATMTFETYTKTGKKAGLKTVPVKKMAKGGKVSQLAKANGIAVRGKSRGKIC